MVYQFKQTSRSSAQYESLDINRNRNRNIKLERAINCSLQNAYREVQLLHYGTHEELFFCTLFINSQSIWGEKILYWQDKAAGTSEEARCELFFPSCFHLKTAFRVKVLRVSQCGSEERFEERSPVASPRTDCDAIASTSERLTICGSTGCLLIKRTLLTFESLLWAGVKIWNKYSWCIMCHRRLLL